MDISTSDFWIRVGLAVLCGCIIGIERQLAGKPAGIRTSIFICLGTNIFISLGVAHSGGNVDMTRVLGQVVTGIGFLGAGVIIAREGLVRGITSASVIWTLAGIGAMIGFGHFLEAVVITVLTVFLLIGIGVLEYRFSSLRRDVHASNNSNDTHHGQ
jgi:putative Mg2+ transporter-C (MgtC) family protein